MNFNDSIKVVCKCNTQFTMYNVTFLSKNIFQKLDFIRSNNSMDRLKIPGTYRWCRNRRVGTSHYRQSKWLTSELIQRPEQDTLWDDQVYKIHLKKSCNDVPSECDFNTFMTSHHISGWAKWITWLNQFRVKYRRLKNELKLQLIDNITLSGKTWIITLTTQLESLRPALVVTNLRTDARQNQCSMQSKSPSFSTNKCLAW